MSGANVAIDTAPTTALGEFARRALAAMEVEVYVRRQAPVRARVAGGWSDQDASSPLALAISRAAGCIDADAFGLLWHARGLAVPSLSVLRASAGEKRKLWRLVRAHRPRA